MHFDVTVRELIENYTVIEQYEDDDVIAEYKALVKSGEISLEDELSMIRVNDIEFDDFQEELSELRDIGIEFDDEVSEEISDLDANSYVITDNMYTFKDIDGVDRYVIEKQQVEKAKEIALWEMILAMKAGFKVKHIILIW